jgi:hypothetical protein
MMKRAICLGCALLLLAGAGSAAAQTDPDTDGIGFYADRDAIANSMAADVGVPVQFYLVHTRCSSKAGTAAWECTVSWTGSVVVAGWNIEGTGPLNFAVPPEFEVGYGIPTPWSPAIVLMNVWCFVQDAGACKFYLGAGPFDSLNNGLPVFVAGDDVEDMRSMYPSSGSTELPVFIINDDGPVATEKMAWSEVRSLYRSR